MKLIIEHLDGTKEEHILGMRKGNDYYDCGITAIGFKFYSMTLQNYVLVHPQSVKKIIYEEENMEHAF